MPGRPTNLDDRWTRALCLQQMLVGNASIFFLSSIFSFFLSPSLGETVQYRLKYFLKGPLNPNNQR